MRGGFGSRGRSNGFERPSSSAAHVETLEQALYPPTRHFYHFPPSMLSQASSTPLQPRIPSSALELCQNAKPLPASVVYGGGSNAVAASVRGSAASSLSNSHHNKVLFQEGPSTSINTVGTVEDIVGWFDAASCGRGSHQQPKLAHNDPQVLMQLGPQGHRQFSALQALLPLELRVFSLEKDALSESEKKTLYKIKQYKKPRLEKPVRRGGVVLSAAAAAGKTPNPKATSTGAKPFVDIAAAEADDEKSALPNGKRSRQEDGAPTVGDDGSERGGGDAADDDENSVSSMGDNADDDDALDDLSGGGGSGDELTF